MAANETTDAKAGLDVQQLEGTRDDKNKRDHNEDGMMLDDLDDLKRAPIDEFGAVIGKISPLEKSLVRRLDWFCLVRHTSFSCLWGSAY
jgi:hypothetical protein